MSASGSKIQDSFQEYQYSKPWISPAGHEFSFYDTPNNERLVIKHSSGSHMEFKADGSVFIKAVKDLHTHSGALSDQNGTGGQGADSTTFRTDRDYTWEVGGRLKIKCTELDFEIDTTARVKAATDLILSGNNVQTKATEGIAMEAEKSMYVDAKEMKERFVSRSTETGTKEGISAVRKANRPNRNAEERQVVMNSGSWDDRKRRGTVSPPRRYEERRWSPPQRVAKG